MDPDELELKRLGPPPDEPEVAKVESPPRGFTLTTWGKITLGVLAVALMVVITLVFWPREDSLDSQLRELENRVDAYLKQNSKGGR